MNELTDQFERYRLKPDYVSAMQWFENLGEIADVVFLHRVPDKVFSHDGTVIRSTPVDPYFAVKTGQQLSITKIKNGDWVIRKYNPSNRKQYYYVITDDNFRNKYEPA